MPANSTNTSGKVTLWTRQDIRSLDELKTHGVIQINRSHLKEKFDLIGDYVIKLYQWFVHAANKRVPKPETVEFPIWCSISEENMLRPTEDSVVYVLEVDAADIIYFDGIKWDYVLNHLYIPTDAADEAAYKKDMENRGHHSLYGFLDESTAHFYPLEKKRVMDSWVRIFDIDEWNIFRVQANIWEIRPEMIKKILYARDFG